MAHFAFVARGSVLALAVWLYGVPLQAQTFDGLWQAEGYGLLLAVDGKNVRAFETTSISCLPSWEAVREAGTDDANQFLFNEGGCIRCLTLDAATDTLRLHSACSSADILWRRATQPPNGYGKKMEDTPQTNYAVFWQTFAENYPFFEVHRTDWAAVDQKTRSRVTSKTSPDELFRILQSTIEPLQDTHTNLNAADLQRGFRGARRNPNGLNVDHWTKAAVIVAQKYIRGDMQYFCKNQVSYGMLDGSVGYLKIWSFANYADQEEYAAQLQALEAALNTIFQDSSKLKGLIIDVRANTGGYDGLGLSIASRLAPQEYLAYSVASRDNPTGPLHFTPAQAVRVVPSSRPGFQGQVVLLTGRDCVSAGETFVMSLMGRRPAVTRIGESTHGVFSDVLARKLPNGWRFGLPNQVYLTAEDKSFDVAGVPPDIALPAYSYDDLQNGRDSALEKALETIRPQKN